MKVSTWLLSIRSLRYYWRSHLGAALGLMVASTVLTGALLTGDCVRSTLQDIALNRLGGIHFAMQHPTRFAREQLADELRDSLAVETSGALRIDGVALHPENGNRSNRVAVIGVDDDFWRMAAEPPEIETQEQVGVVLNQRLAETLKAKVGESVLLRMEKPSAISRDAPLSTVDDSIAALRVPVRAIVGDRALGRFDLRANQVAPNNAFLPLRYMQDELKQPGRINMIVAGNNPTGSLSLEDIDQALKTRWTLDDAQIELRHLETQAATEMRSDRIFLDEVFSREVQTAVAGNSVGILTYLVNGLSANGNTAPYSMVSAIGNLSEHATQPYAALNGLQPNEIVINRWLADDLQAKVGDALELAYFVMGPMRALVEETRSFRIARIVEMDDPINDRDMMPDFPGISEADHCREWDPGFAIDNEKIRDKDETYWDEFKGTPKAFLSLETGQQLWSNRFGNLTAIRIANTSPDNLRGALKLSPGAFGFYFQPAREQALLAVRQSMDFGGLFIGLSFFLIVAALLLSALLFLFSIEQRVEETGILLGVGFSHRRIQRLFLLEGFLIACIGGGLGVLAAVGYTKAMLWLLATVWSGAVAGATFTLHLSFATLLTGFASSVIAGMIALWLGIRNQSKLPIRQLLSSAGMFASQLAPSFSAKASKSWIITAAGFILAIAMLFWNPGDDAMALAGKFFGVGSLLLVTSIGVSRILISKWALNTGGQSLSLAAFGMRNLARRAGRSVAVIGMLACGSFMVIAVGSNRQNSAANADLRKAGTGGYDFYAEMTLPLLHDLNTEEGCNEFGLSRDDINGTAFVPIRVRAGDEASCLNLNHAQQPRLMGVNPAAFSSEGAFTFTNTLNGALSSHEAWALLNRPLENGAIPGIADQASIQWAMQKSLGDSILYTDEQGRTFNVRLVGALSNSIFQGAILISEDAFIQRYPSVSGYNAMLVDMPNENREAVVSVLNSALQDIGADFVLTSERLAAYTAVQNTYIAIFQALGGLGLILGCAGIGVVALRNVLERRGELAILRAVGFPLRQVRWMVMSEHLLLLLLGILCGSVSGFSAAWPAMQSNAVDVPYFSLIFTLLFMLASGAAWIAGAAWFAMRGPILNALRNE